MGFMGCRSLATYVGADLQANRPENGDGTLVGQIGEDVGIEFPGTGISDYTSGRICRLQGNAGDRAG